MAGISAKVISLVIEMVICLLYLANLQDNYLPEWRSNDPSKSHVCFPLCRDYEATGVEGYSLAGATFGNHSSATVCNSRSEINPLVLRIEGLRNSHVPAAPQ